MTGLESHASLRAAAAALLISGCVTSAEVGGKPQDDAEGSGDETTAETSDGATDTTVGATETETTGTTGDTDGPPGASGRCTLQSSETNEWVFHCGSIAQETLAGAGVDGDGNIYFAFDFRGWDETEFASLEIGDETIQNTGLSDTVIVKLDADGAVVWTRHFGGADDQYVSKLSACADRILITGTADPGTLDLGGGVLPHAEYIAAFDRDGQHLWSRSFEVEAPDGWVHFADLVCDDDGNVITGGGFRDGVDLGDGMLEGGVQDTFVAKLDTDGALLWVRGGNANGYAAGFGNIELAPGGDIVIVGSFGGEIDLGGGPITASDGDDGYVARYDPEGEYLWGMQIGADGLQYARGVSIAADGTIAVVGTFLTSIEIAGETFENVFPEQIPDKHGTAYDVFVATLDASGAWGWALHEGTMLDDQVFGQSFVTSELLVLGHSTEGLRLDTYIDGAPTTQRVLTGSAFFGGSVEPTPEGRILVAAMLAAPEPTFAEIPIEVRGNGDLIIAKLVPVAP